MRRTRSFQTKLLLAVVAALASALLAGCPGSLENPERFACVASGTCPKNDAGGNPPDSATGDDSGGGGGVDCSDVDVVTDVFTGAGCSAGGCHSAAETLDLASADIYTRLKDVDASGAYCAGKGLKWINSANPAASAIYTEITPTPQCSIRMPVGATETSSPVTDHQIECVKQWITEMSQ